MRDRCSAIGHLCEAGKGKYFSVQSDNLQGCIDLVVEECRNNYPDLNMPYHSRWRHFELADVDLWQHYKNQSLSTLDALSRARAAIDLVFVSVLLDAGAGADWKFIDPVSKQCLQRSEGLAAASVELFFNYLAKPDESQGLVVDANALEALDVATFEKAFQHSAENPLLGVKGRLSLLNGLKQVLAKPGSLDRPGAILDEVLAVSENGEVEADQVLQCVLNSFNSMWPSGLMWRGRNLGDCGIYGDGEYDSIVPFHKLSQWLTYSLFEPLEWAGLEITNKDGMTGLPEYRNGGLLLETGVVVPIDPELLQQTLSVDSEAVVEWRALTVYLLDQVAAGVRKSLNKTEQELPLASVLQGGTWSAGRKIANSNRGDGSPPIKLAIDGTIF